MCNVIVMYYRAYHVSIVIMCCEWCTCATFVALPLPLGAPVTFLRLSRASFTSPLHALLPCMQSRSFSVVGPLVCNGLPLPLRSLPRVFNLKSLQQLKTTLLGGAWVGSASE